MQKSGLFAYSSLRCGFPKLRVLSCDTNPRPVQPPPRLLQVTSTGCEVHVAYHALISPSSLIQFSHLLPAFTKL